MNIQYSLKHVVWASSKAIKYSPHDGCTGQISLCICSKDVIYSFPIFLGDDLIIDFP